MLVALGLLRSQLARQTNAQSGSRAAAAKPARHGLVAQLQNRRMIASIIVSVSSGLLVSVGHCRATRIRMKQCPVSRIGAASTGVGLVIAFTAAVLTP